MEKYGTIRFVSDNAWKKKGTELELLERGQTPQMARARGRGKPDG
jgi:hypothetical protein